MTNTRKENALKSILNMSRCFGNEKCLAEFELLDMSPGTKLHGLGKNTNQIYIKICTPK